MPEDERPVCYLAGLDDASRTKAFLLAEQLRAQGISSECDLMQRSLKAQMKYADKLGARFVAVIGDTELEKGEAQVKDMRTSASERVKFEELAQYFNKR